MKGLLQSKIFRKNLKKWLCMYVGALLLLTTVVTYSKYISSLVDHDEKSRITQFDVAINNVDDSLYCEDEIDSSTNETKRNCTTKIEYRPTSKITYEFMVTPNFEVKTLLATTIYIPANFKILSLDEINGKNLYNAEKKEKDESVTISDITEIDENGKEVKTATIITVTREINMPETDDKTKEEIKEEMALVNAPKTYKIDIQYDYKEDKFNDANKENLMMIKVGYSAEQKR